MSDTIKGGLSVKKIGWVSLVYGRGCGWIYCKHVGLIGLYDPKYARVGLFSQKKRSDYWAHFYIVGIWVEFLSE